jgi:hypothetical protein
LIDTTLRPLSNDEGEHVISALKVLCSFASAMQECGELQGSISQISGEGQHVQQLLCRRIPNRKLIFTVVSAFVSFAIWVLVLAATALGCGLGATVRDASQCAAKEQKGDWIASGMQSGHVIRTIGPFDLDVSVTQNDGWEEDIQTSQMLRTFTLDNLRARGFFTVLRASGPEAPCLHVNFSRTNDGKDFVYLELTTPDPKGRWECVEWTRGRQNVDDNPHSIKAAVRGLLDLFTQDFQPTDQKD